MQITIIIKIICHSFLVFMLSASVASAAPTFFFNQGDFNSNNPYQFAGTEDFESSTLGPNSFIFLDDPLAPGVANTPFPNGTNPDTRLTVQSNQSGATPTNPNPRGTNGLTTVSAGLAGTPTDQGSAGSFGDSLDLIFGPDASAVSFTPLAFDTNSLVRVDNRVDIRVYDTSNVEIASTRNVLVNPFTTADTFVGIVAMVGQPIGRINILATAVGTNTTLSNLVAGADNISVYTPVPSAVLLMGTGLFGLVGWRWWNTKKS